MRLDSRLSQHDYLHYMRQNARFRFGDPCEGFSGVVIGNFFLVRYHAVNGNEKQRLDKETWQRPRCTYNAFGIVRPGDYGTEVQYMYTVGFLDPFSAVFFLVVGILASLQGGFLLEEPGIASLVAAFLSVFLIVVSAIKDSNARCAERGRRKVLKLLEDPSKGETN